MPKLTNKGFGIIPILVLVSVLSILTYAGYSYYKSLNSSEALATIEEENKDTDVLQATSGGANSKKASVNPLLTKFIEDTYLLNAKGFPLIWGTDDKLYMSGKYNDANNFPDPIEVSGCGFFTRGSKPIVVNQKYFSEGTTKTLSYRAYAAKFLALSKLQEGGVVYIVLDLPVNAPESLIPAPNVRFIKNDCENLIIFKKPNDMVFPTAAELPKFYTIKGAGQSNITSNNGTYEYLKNGKIIRVTYAGPDAQGAAEAIKDYPQKIVKKGLKLPVGCSGICNVAYEEVLLFKNLKIQNLQPGVFYFDLPNDGRIISIVNPYSNDKKFEMRLKSSSPKSIETDFDLIQNRTLENKRIRPDIK